MSAGFSRDFPGKHAALLLVVAVLLLVSSLLDHAFVSSGEFIDLVYIIPIVAAAILLLPLEVLLTGILSMLFELTTETASFHKAPDALWMVLAIGGFALIAAGVSYYVRRRIGSFNIFREDLINSPVAYATFRFPGYDLIRRNTAFESMFPIGAAGSRYPFASLPEEVGTRLSDLMDKAVAGRVPISEPEFQLPAGEGGSTFWDITLMPARTTGRETPKSISLFGVDVTGAVMRSRTRDAALKMSSSVMASLDLDKTIHAVLESLAHIAQTNAGGLFLIEDDQWVGMAGWGDYTDEMAKTLRWPYDDLPTGVDAVTMQRAVAIEDAANDPRFSAQRVQMFNIRSALVVPLVAGNRAIGACWLNQTDGIRRFSNEQIEFATVVGAQAALAIENASIYENEHMMRKSLEAIEAISEVGLTSLDLDEVLIELVTRAQDVMRMDAAAIFLVDHQSEHLIVRAATGRSARNAGGCSVEVGSGGLAGRCFRDGVPVKIDDLNGREKEFCSFHGGESDQCPYGQCHGIRSALAVPLRRDGRVVGVLQLGSTQVSAFSAREWGLIQVLAERASMAVQNSMHHMEIQQELARVALLRDVAAACAGLSDSRDIAERALEAVFEQLGCRTASIYYVDQENGVLVNLAFSGHPPEVAEDFRTISMDSESFIPRAVRERAVIVHDSSSVEEIPEIVRPVLKKIDAEDCRLIFLPVIYKDEAVGAIAMAFPDMRPFSHEGIEILKGIANQLAPAIWNSLQD